MRATVYEPVSTSSPKVDCGSSAAATNGLLPGSTNVLPSVTPGGTGSAAKSLTTPSLPGTAAAVPEESAMVRAEPELGAGAGATVVTGAPAPPEPAISSPSGDW